MEARETRETRQEEHSLAGGGKGEPNQVKTMDKGVRSRAGSPKKVERKDRSWGDS